MNKKRASTFMKPAFEFGAKPKFLYLHSCTCERCKRVNARTSAVAKAAGIKTRLCYADPHKYDYLDNE